MEVIYVVSMGNGKPRGVTKSSAAFCQLPPATMIRPWRVS
jgi:hypothetical protein